MNSKVNELAKRINLVLIELDSSADQIMVLARVVSSFAMSSSHILKEDKKTGSLEGDMRELHRVIGMVSKDMLESNLSNERLMAAVRIVENMGPKS